MSEFVKLRAIAVDLSIGPSTIRAMVAKGDFPKPVVMGGCNRWIKSEVDAWKENKISERDAATVAGGVQ